ncbi:hypothetical protein ABXN37_12840 [Piscinibacter sakaiensis]
MNAKLRTTQTMDQFSASFTETLWAPCFFSTTKSTKSATSTDATKKTQSQVGAMESKGHSREEVEDRAERSCRGVLADPCCTRAIGIAPTFRIDG